VTDAVFNGFRDYALELDCHSPGNSLRPARGDYQLVLDGPAPRPPRPDPPFDQLHHIPITGRPRTELTQQLPELGERLASRLFEAVDLSDHAFPAPVFGTELLELQKHRRQRLRNAVVKQAGKLGARFLGRDGGARVDRVCDPAGGFGGRHRV
jgi:hypothetical protein